MLHIGLTAQQTTIGKGKKGPGYDDHDYWIDVCSISSSFDVRSICILHNRGSFCREQNPPRSYLHSRCTKKRTLTRKAPFNFVTGIKLAYCTVLVDKGWRFPTCQAVGDAVEEIVIRMFTIERVRFFSRCRIYSVWWKVGRTKVTIPDALDRWWSKEKYDVQPIKGVRRLCRRHQAHHFDLYFLRSITGTERHEATHVERYSEIMN